MSLRPSNALPTALRRLSSGCSLKAEVSQSHNITSQVGHIIRALCPPPWIILMFSNKTSWQPVPRKRVTSCGSSSNPCWSACISSSVVLWAHLWSVIVSAQNSCFPPNPHCAWLHSLQSLYSWFWHNYLGHGGFEIEHPACFLPHPRHPTCLTGLKCVGSWSWHANTDPPSWTLPSF